MNKKDALKHKKKKSHKLQIVFWVLLCSAVSVATALAFACFGAESLGGILGQRDYWLSVGVVNGLIMIFYLMAYKVDAANVVAKENDLEDTEFLTAKNLKKSKEFTVTEWGKLSELSDGIVIGAEKKGKEVEIITTKQLHAIAVGTTGSGKTTGFVDQNIAILSEFKTKPSMVITDPKKELYEKHANHLKNQGYKVSVLDLREPYSSEKWNPMNCLLKRIKKINYLADVENKDGRYYGGDEEFLTYNDALIRRQELQDEIVENAKELVYTLCPITDNEQPMWEQGARDLIAATVLAFCEDVAAGKMSGDKLALFNVYYNLSRYSGEEQIQVLKDYLLKGRDRYSKVVGLANTVLLTTDRTLSSYMTSVNGYVQQLADDGILSMTSGNDFDFSKIDEEPNAVFIVVPDERFTRHKFVSLFISQVYKDMVEKANVNLKKGETEEMKLKRNLYFVLDEFANIPKIEKFENLITVGRSRGIKFLLVVQSYSQLTAKYGANIDKCLRDNCNVKIFIGSSDYETRREFSELCGNKKIKSLTIGTGAGENATANTGAANQPLISPSMLGRINGDEKGDAVVIVLGHEPIWSHFTPSYELEKVYFADGRADMSRREAVLFDKLHLTFDISGFDEEKEQGLTMDEINEAEREEWEGTAQEEEKNADAEKRRTEWFKVKERIDAELKDLAKRLTGEDAKALLSVKLENKSTLLYALMGKYNMTDAETMQRYADKLASEYYPKLLKLQDERQK